MPFYYTLWHEDEGLRRRTAAGLRRLRSQFVEDQVPERTVSGTLLLATWNIREFDSPKYGARTAESLYYIAEIISRFDLIAIQEVREDLAALDRVQSILGGWWKYLVTDVTEGTAGNRERMAFMYDSRKVTFGGLAGEIVLDQPRKGPSVLQFARTPFICGFKAGWSKFNLCTVHIYYGKDAPDDPRRIQEVRDLAAFLARRADGPEQPARPDGKVTAVRNVQPENLILLGDFNIFGQGDETLAAIKGAGFTIPDELTKRPGSNLKQDKFYDQIAFLARPERFGTTGRAGVFDYYKSVFRADEGEIYASSMEGRYENAKDGARAYREWRTYQMSDHLLLWVELRTDYSDAYLHQLAGDSVAEVAEETIRRPSAPSRTSKPSKRRTSRAREAEDA